MNRYKFSSIFLSSFFFLFFVTPAFAHVIVKPATIGIATVTTFDMQVPSEQDTPTVLIKLLIPKGVQEVVPDVKPGWDINVIKSGDTVTEIDWANGTISPGQRDEFYFSAQVPPTPTTLQWKAYQTYADGTVISWDHAPTANPQDDSAPPPYSMTKVINDLVATPVATKSEEEHTSQKADLAIFLSGIAVLIASVAVSLAKKRTFVLQEKKKK